MTSLILAASHGDSDALAVLDDSARELGMRAVDLFAPDVDAYLIVVGRGDGYAPGNGDGYGYGTGTGYGDGDGDSYGYGTSTCAGYGDGEGYGTGTGDGYGDGDSYCANDGNAISIAGSIK